MERSLRIGVLALQGAFREHAAALRKLGADVVEVRLPEELDGLDGLVIPGGESTTIMRLAELYGLDDAIRAFAGAVFGTCAGMIVLDREHLDLADLVVDRNAFGRQVRSFEADVDLDGDEIPLHGVFIRAPRIRDLGDGRRGARRARRRARARARRAPAARVVPPRADGRPARARAVPDDGRGGEPCPGIASGRSIKHKKGAADAKRGQLFSKLSRAIIVAAKEGGPDPSANLALQNAIEKARSYSMPKDNIERAIAKGSGADAEAASFETVVYEGYGPEGVAVLVEALTDNRNRTASEVRHAFTKHGGNLGTTGAVAWQFERRGRRARRRADGADEDELVAGRGRSGRRRRRARRVELRGHERAGVADRRAPGARGRRASRSSRSSSRWCRRRRSPSRTSPTARRIMNLVEGLEDTDDVQDVYANFDIPEAVLEAVAS